MTRGLGEKTHPVRPLVVTVSAESQHSLDSVDQLISQQKLHFLPQEVLIMLNDFVYF